jgi:quercetin dioxygenase-like cupin family protein
MQTLDPAAAARAAVAAPGRPATAMIHDTPDLRLLVFRIAPGQTVPLHRNASSVTITVLAGSGELEGEVEGASVRRACAAGDVVAYLPNEPHAMHATRDELLLMAAITPRPGTR